MKPSNVRPSVSGKLHHIDLPVYPAHYAQTFPVTVTVVETVNGEPTGRVLAQTMLPPLEQNTTPKGAFFRSSQPVLRAGALYAFIIAAPLQTSGLIIQTPWEGNQYQRGSMWRKLGDGTVHINKTVYMNRYCRGASCNEAAILARPMQSS